MYIYLHIYIYIQWRTQLGLQLLDGVGAVAVVHALRVVRVAHLAKRNRAVALIRSRIDIYLYLSIHLSTLYVYVYVFSILYICI